MLSVLWFFLYRFVLLLISLCGLSDCYVLIFDCLMCFVIFLSSLSVCGCSLLVFLCMKNVIGMFYWCWCDSVQFGWFVIMLNRCCLFYDGQNVVVLMFLSVVLCSVLLLFCGVMFMLVNYCDVVWQMIGVLWCQQCMQLCVYFLLCSSELVVFSVLMIFGFVFQIDRLLNSGSDLIQWLLFIIGLMKLELVILCVLYDMKFLILYVGDECMMLVLVLVVMQLLRQMGVVCLQLGWVDVSGWWKCRFVSFMLGVVVMMWFVSLKLFMQVLMCFFVMISSLCLVLISVQMIFGWRFSVWLVGIVYGVVVQIMILLLVCGSVGRLNVCVVFFGFVNVNIMLIVGLVWFLYLIFVFVSVELQLKYQFIGFSLWYMQFFLMILLSVWIFFVLFMKFIVLYGFVQLLSMLRCLKLIFCFLICLVVYVCVLFIILVVGSDLLNCFLIWILIGILW